jgi:hypothetical protein
MHFNLHKKIRYYDWSDYQYLIAVKKYYAYLNSIDFTPGKDLLKYFGDSFFHEGGVKEFLIDLKAKRIIMLIYRDSDREDINDIRKKMNLKLLTIKQYQKDPILYRCSFSGVKTISASVVLSRLWADNEIMDTETTYIKREKKFNVVIGFWKNDEISFKCDYSTVKIINSNRVRELTNGKIIKMPFCEYCKAQLVTTDRISQRLKETNKELKNIKKCGARRSSGNTAANICSL